MKNILLLLVFTVLVTQQVPAQIAEHSLVGLSSKKAASPLAKATAATGSRMIANVTVRSNAVVYELMDSAHYSYSGTRDFDPSSEYLKYDNGMSWEYNTSTLNYENNNRLSHTFGANDDMATGFFESWNTTTSAWENNGQVMYTYDAAHNFLTELYQSWNSSTSSWDNAFKKTYTYDANNNRLSYLYQMWDGSVWYNNYQALYTYNASNKRIQEITQSWVSATNSWKNLNQTVYTYDANNDLTLEVGKHWVVATSSWDNGYQDIYTYDGSHRLLIDLFKSWDLATSAFVNNEQTVYSNFAGDNPQTIIKQDWNSSTSSFENEQRRQLTYNNYGQELTEYYDTWNIGGFWQATNSDYGYRHYYEEYATDVKSLTAKGGNANIYPVPAKDILNIDLNWNETQPFTISIIDLQGRVSRQWQVAATANYHTAVSVNELPFGTYIIKIDGAKGQIVKQLIVSPE